MRLTRWRAQLRRCRHDESQAHTLPHDATDEGSLLGAFKSCKTSRDVEKARGFHSRALQLDCSTSIRVACALVRMFSRCGSMQEAREVFDSMPRRDINSWNELLAGYVENSRPELALAVFSAMDHPPPDGRSIVSALKACSSLAAGEESKQVDDGRELKVNSLHRGMCIHRRASELGLERNIFVSNTLIDMYVKCGDLLQARRVFDGISRPTLVSWNVLLLGYAENGQEELALSLLDSMQRRKLSPDSRTFSAAAKACAKLAEKEPGESKPNSLRRASAIHSSAASSGCLNADVFLTASMINMFSKAGSIANAQKVFDDSQSQDTATWNSLMLGYTENKQPAMALHMFDMIVSGKSQLPPCCKMNHLTFYAALTACARLADDENNKNKNHLARVRMIHAQARGSGCESNILVASNLVDLYARLGSLADARGLFDKMKSHDLVSRASLMQAFAEKGDPEVALSIYSVMRREGLRLDAGCLLGALRASGKLASVESCRNLHGDACRIGAEDDSFLVATLLDAFGRSGVSMTCQLLFDSVVKRRGRVVWTALISGYTRSGESCRVFDAFNQMVEDGFQPDAPSLCCLISACSAAGLVDLGKRVFSSMASKFNVAPDPDHYHAMIDLLGRANRLGEAVELVEGMPAAGSSAATWNTVLGACWKWRDVELARYAFQRCLELDERHQLDSSYVLMGNIYGSLGMWEQQAEVENMRRRRASRIGRHEQHNP